LCLCEARSRFIQSRDSGSKEVDSLREENRGYRKQVGMLEQRLEELSGRIKDIDSARVSGAGFCSKFRLSARAFCSTGPSEKNNEQNRSTLQYLFL
jgi:hypothetical protein